MVDILGAPHPPMLGHIPQTVDAGGLARNSGVKTTRDGALDRSLAGLLQLCDQLLLALDIALDTSIDMAQITNDGALLDERGGGILRASNFSLVKWAIVALSLRASNHPVAATVLITYCQKTLRLCSRGRTLWNAFWMMQLSIRSFRIAQRPPSPPSHSSRSPVSIPY